MPKYNIEFTETRTGNVTINAPCEQMADEKFAEMWCEEHELEWDKVSCIVDKIEEIKEM